MRAYTDEEMAFTFKKQQDARNAKLASNIRKRKPKENPLGPVISTSVAPSTYQQIKEIADKQGVTIAWVARQAILKYLE